MEKENDNLTRYPQGLNFNPEALLKAFGKESVIIRDMLILASNEFSSDMFNDIFFTREDFEKMGHRRDELQRVIEPYSHYTKQELGEIVKKRREQLGIANDATDYNITTYGDVPSEHPFIGDHLCITNLEYAIYKARTFSLNLYRKKNDVLSTSELRILDGLKISNVSKATKRKYMISISSTLVKNLLQEYHLIDLLDYAAIQTPKIDKTGSYRNFYLYIGRMIAQIQYRITRRESAEYVLSVDELCNIFGSETREFKDKKKYITSSLNDIAKMVRFSRFEWKYVPNPNSNDKRTKGFVKFIFSKDVLEYFEEKKKKKYLITLTQHLKGEFIRKNVVERAGTLSMDDDTKYFAWLKSPEDMDIKIALQEKIYNQIYRVQSIQRRQEQSPQKHYIDIGIMQEMAHLAKTNIEDYAKKMNYKSDENGYYKLL